MDNYINNNNKNTEIIKQNNNINMYHLHQTVNIFTACHISEVVNTVIYSRLRQNLASFQDDIM